jgi:hypothetical protein
MMTVRTDTAEIVAQMPTMEFAAFPTNPIPRVDELCAYCEIRLGAIPDPPKPVFADDGQIVHVHYCCAGPYRTRQAGIHFELPGPSEPR